MVKPVKILIEMKHGLGDCVCMLPAIKAVRETYPEAYIAMIVNDTPNEDIIKHSGIKINKFYYLSLKNRPKAYTLKVVWQLWREHFDYGILAIMTPLKKGKILFKILGVKRCLGEQFQGLHFHDLDNKIHFVKRNINVVKNICCDINDNQPHLYVTQSEQAYFKTVFPKNKKIIAINIGGGDKHYYRGDYVYTKDWDQKYMVELVRLLSELDCEICLLGGKLEEIFLEEYGSVLSKPNVKTFVNKTSIIESMALVSLCDISVGVDTGMQHIADALGIVTISIFGPTNPRMCGAFSSKAIFLECKTDCPYKYCFDTDIYYTCPDRKCLNSLMPEEVFYKIKSLL